MTITLEQWATLWGVSDEALADLRMRLSYTPAQPDLNPNLPESMVQSQVRLSAAKSGIKLWRNNVGALKAENGRYVRFGLCNDSPSMNKLVKSSDLIGIKPLMITQGHVGTIIGQFIAREVKHSHWVYTGNEREQAQLRFIELVKIAGGDASFITYEEGEM